MLKPSANNGFHSCIGHCVIPATCNINTTNIGNSVTALKAYVRSQISGKYKTQLQWPFQWFCQK